MSYNDSLTPGTKIFDIGTIFLLGRYDNNCKKHYINKQITDTIGYIIANHIKSLKNLTNKEEIKTKLLDIKSEVENKLDKTNECDKYVIDYYFRKNDNDIMKSRVKEALFGKSTATPSKSILIRLLTRRKPSRKVKTPSKGGKTKKKRHSK